MSKLFNGVIRGILLLENSGLNGSEVSAVLDHDRVMNGLAEKWPATATRRRRARSIMAMTGTWNFLEETTRRKSGSTQRRIRTMSQPGASGQNTPVGSPVGKSRLGTTHRPATIQSAQVSASTPGRRRGGDAFQCPSPKTGRGHIGRAECPS